MELNKEERFKKIEVKELIDDETGKEKIITKEIKDYSIVD
jgi:hypothetical protein